MRAIRRNVYVLFVLALGIVAFAFIKTSSDLKAAELKNTAIQECFKAATVTTKADNTERVEPIFYIYQLCLQDKGYTTNYTAK